MSHLRLLPLLIGLAAGSLKAAEDSEVVIHSGPVTSTPKLGTLTTSGVNLPGGTIQVTREFRVSQAEFEKLAVHSPRRPPDVWQGQLSATEALRLARASIETGEEPVIRELKLSLSPESPDGPENRALEYYFVHAVANGSQVYRVVLMDGTVLKPTIVPASE